MNLLSLILVFLGLAVGASVFYIAWELSSGKMDDFSKKEPGESKEPEDSPGS